MRQTRPQHGFTLIELIMVIVIGGILATMTVSFITKPMEGYVDLAHRAELVDNAEMAMRQIARDIRRALPNSVRETTTVNGIEMINTLGGGRYRAQGPGQILDFTTPTSQFEIIGNSLPAETGRLVVYNMGNSGADAYAGDAVITPMTTNVTIAGNPQLVTLSADHQFPFESPRQRVFLVDNVIRYYCDTGTLFRQSCSIASSPVCGTEIPVTNNVASCSFDYDPGTATRSALATIRLTLSSRGENIELLHQVHVDNVP